MYEVTGPQPPKGAHAAHTASGATPFLKPQGPALSVPHPGRATGHGHDPRGRMQRRAKYRHREGRGGSASFDMYGCFWLGAGIKELPTS